jgi:hypothetical protein
MGVDTARKTLQSTCDSCHTANRVQLPDKTYEIKNAVGQTRHNTTDGEPSVLRLL